MKKIVKLTALAMSTLLVTMAFASCNNDKGTSEDVPEVKQKTVYDGTHIYTATDTNEYLVKDGKTNYSLVVPLDHSSSLRIAKTEFADLFYEATSININVLTDEDVTDASQGKFISLGETELLKNSGIEIDHAKLTNDGHRIVTKGDDVYLCGGSDEGTVFAVYTFMKLTFDYETYYLDAMDIERTLEKKLKNYDVTDIPDFKFRAHSTDVTTYESADYGENMYAWRLNYYGKDAHRGYYFMPVHENIVDFSQGKKSASTNARRWFPEWMYKNEADADNYHPKWFSDNGGEQLCFSAHGDEEEYEMMLDTAFTKVVAHLQHYTPDKYPNYKIMTLTHMDNTNYCTCDKCKEISSYYGDSQAAIQILFMNDLAKRVDAVLAANTDKDWYREDFKLLFFAYNHNLQPPARYDATTKKYVPIDSKVVLHDRLIAWFARDGEGQTVFNEGSNAAQLSILDGWAAVAKHINFWNYGTSFRNYMMPTDTFQYITPEMFAYYCNISDDFWFTQYQDKNVCRNTAWHGLKVYLDARLSWNTSLDSNELINKWMKAMYKDAAPTMMRLFQSERSYIRNVIIGKHQASASSELALAEYWPIGVLEGWLKQIDLAKADVERYRETDPALYNKTCMHIETEAISFIYILLQTQGYTIASEVRAEYIERLRYDIEWLDLSNMVIRTQTTTLVSWLDNL